MAQSQRTTHDLRGRVMCEGRGVPGVVVTDGVDCVLTDEDIGWRVNVMCVMSILVHQPDI